MKTNNSEQIRPLSFDTYIGQQESIAKLKVAIQSAKTRGVALGHVLLKGPAGCGKTTLASIIAHELNVRIESAVATSVKSDMDFYGLLNQIADFEKPNILFLDEIHRLSEKVQECMYTILEDSRLTVKEGAGRVSVYKVAPITIIGGTTLPGKLSRPLLDRFDIKLTLHPYTIEECERIAELVASKLEPPLLLTPEARRSIALSSKNTARTVTKLVKAARDIAVTQQQLIVTQDMVSKALDMDQLTKEGLEIDVDIKLLKFLFKSYPTPIGLSSMAQILDEDSTYLSKHVEPFLCQQGYILRQKGGRQITKSGIDFLLQNQYITANDIVGSGLQKVVK